MPAARGPHKLRGAYYTRAFFSRVPLARVYARTHPRKITTRRNDKSVIPLLLPPVLSFSPPLCLLRFIFFPFSLYRRLWSTRNTGTEIRACTRRGYRTRGEAQGFWATQAIKPEDLATPIAIIVITRHALQCKCLVNSHRATWSPRSRRHPLEIVLR